LEYADMRGRALALFHHSSSPGFRFFATEWRKYTSLN
jgi:hypothetical protein